MNHRIWSAAHAVIVVVAMLASMSHAATVNYSTGVHNELNPGADTFNIFGDASVTKVDTGHFHSVVNVFGEASVASISSYGTVSLHGEATVNSITNRGAHGAVYISGGELTGTVGIHETSVAYISGGTVNQIDGYGDSTITMTGGSVNMLWGVDNATFNIYGSNLALTFLVSEGGWSKYHSRERSLTVRISMRSSGASSVRGMTSTTSTFTTSCRCLPLVGRG